MVPALIVCLCCLHSAALAQEVPEYDIEARCERLAGSNAPENRQFNSCLFVEEYAMGAIEDHWPEADDTIRNECLEEANPTESYVVLASCIMDRIRRQGRP